MRWGLKVNLDNALRRLKSMDLVKVNDSVVYLTEEGKFVRRKLVSRLAEEFAVIAPEVLKAVEAVKKHGLKNRVTKFQLQRSAEIVSSIAKRNNMCLFPLTLALCEVYGNQIKDIMTVIIIGSKIDNIKEADNFKNTVKLARYFLSL